MTARTFAFTKTTPYYRRHRALPMLVSSDELSTEPADMLITRYGDQGSRYYRPWDAYYHKGKFYRIVSHATTIDEDGKPAEYIHAFAPITDAQIRDRYPRHTDSKADAFPGAIVTIKKAKETMMKTTKTYTRDDVIKNGEYLGAFVYEAGTTLQRWLLDGLVFAETCSADGRTACWECLGKASKVLK